MYYHSRLTSTATKLQTFSWKRGTRGDYSLHYKTCILFHLVLFSFFRGDVIGLFMENRPEYVCIWLGIAKAGIVPALINNQLKKQSLSHTFTAADVKAIVYGEELEDSK